MSRRSNDGAVIALMIGAAISFFWALIKYPVPTIIGVNILVAIYSPENAPTVFILSAISGAIYLWVEKSKTQAEKQTIDKKIEEKFGARTVDKNQSLVERNEYIIQKKIGELRATHRSYYIENEVRDCLADIALAEGESKVGPRSGQYLKDWSNRTDLPKEWTDLRDEILKRFKNKFDELKVIEKKKEEEKKKEQDIKIEKEGQELLSRNKDLVDKFLEITERKVSTIDDYGDENWEALPNEILACLKKVGQREGVTLKVDEYLKEKKKNSFWFRHPFPETYQWAQKKLEEIFRDYHHAQSNIPSNNTDLDNLSGVEFEAWVTKLLKENGFTDIRGTPPTGDQGADLIVKKDDKVIIIQAKRYKSAVGNKAVQEVIGALHFYSGDAGWVITNSTFTQSAKELAHKSNIKLIDGKMLKEIGKHLG